MRPDDRRGRRLNALAVTPVNYDAAALDLAHPPDGWTVDRRTVRLISEPPGAPVRSGSFETACRLIRGYEFADPSLVRAFYDSEAPLQGRTMLLELRALGLVSIHVGVRVVEVYDDTREDNGRAARCFGWAYRTLEGHVERGQMNWEVWKWLDSGVVEFRVHAVSQVATISNPVIWTGFHLLRRYERRLFLNSTGRRMRELTERAVRDPAPADAVRVASAATTARSISEDDPAHEALARELDDDQ